MPLEEIPVREYVDARFTAEQRAGDMAERERRASATALAVGLERTIEEGDERLREHISNQIEQIRAALASAEKLELERIARVVARVEAVQSEVLLAAGAAEKAIAKADAANEKRFDGINEFRGTLADQAKDLLPREVFEAQHAELSKRVQAMSELLGKLAA